MLKILILPIFICSIVLAASTVQKPVNVDCPYSDNKIKNGETLQFGVCCSNCLKKATSNLPEFLKKTKPNNKTCSYSAKPARKKFVVGFCCSKCKKKASS